MNPIRVFAKLAARVPPCDLQPGATSAPEVDAAIAAALCAGMSARCYRAALARYAFDDTVRDWVGIDLWRTAMERAQRDNWKTSGQVVSRQARWGRCYPVWNGLSGAERASFERAMVDTEGVGFARAVAHILLAEVYEPCFWGQADSWQRKAALLGVGKSAWFGTWHKRVASVGMVFDGWCSAAVGHVARRQVEIEEAA